MKGRKLTILFLALGLPLMLATYFKYCTSAHFDVPVRFIDGIVSEKDCQPVISKPYAIPDSVLAKLGWDGSKKLTCMFLSTSTNGASKRKNRILELHADVSTLDVDSSKAALNSCYLFMSKDSATMLIDQGRRVRGYYGNSLKESDRLITEVNILLEN